MVESTNSKDNQNKFAVSLITPWIKGSMFCSDNFLHVDMPNTVFFGLIPAGKEKDSTPLSGVTNVYTSNSYSLGAIALGALIALSGLSMLGTSAIGAIVVIAIGAAILCSGIKTQLSYERSGIVKTIKAPFFEADKIKHFEQEILSKISEYQDDRNMRMQTEKSMTQNNNNTHKIVDAINNSNASSNDKTSATAKVTDSAATFCPNCGTKLSPNSKFCSHCGTKLF